MEEHEKKLLLKLAEQEIGPQQAPNSFPDLLNSEWVIPLREIEEKDWLFLKLIIRTKILKRMIEDNI